MAIDWEKTGDGSLSCRDKETGQLCHNRAGAALEALKNYTEPAGLLELLQSQERLFQTEGQYGEEKAAEEEPKEVREAKSLSGVANLEKAGIPQRPTIRLLDACYGLGYNTWVTADFLLRHVNEPFTLSVVAIERLPDIIQESPLIFDHPSLSFLKSKLSPSEHNIYYRTLRCILDNKIPRFKVRFVEKRSGNPDHSEKSPESWHVQFLVFDAERGWQVFPQETTHL